MNQNRDRKTEERIALRDQLASDLRADFVDDLPAGRPSMEPAALLALTVQLEQRLQSTGGRPTDPRWELTRQVPFATSTWDDLGEVAEALSARGRRIAKGQLAAVLIEAGLDRLSSANGETSPEALDAFLASRDLDSLDGPSAR